MGDTKPIHIRLSIKDILIKRAEQMLSLADAMVEKGGTPLSAHHKTLIRESLIEELRTWGNILVAAYLNNTPEQIEEALDMIHHITVAVPKQYRM